MFSYICGKINSEDQMERFNNNWNFFLDLPEAPSNSAVPEFSFCYLFVCLSLDGSGSICKNPPEMLIPSMD